MAELLCVFGTGSDVGKSWLVAGLCRLFHRAGVDVTPYKAQNLSNNAGVTPTGEELGRAQIVQAQAAGLVPHVDMNPLLLKPHRERGVQVVAMGHELPPDSDLARGGFPARQAMVQGALDRLMARHALVVAEGAGSCAEVNLRGRDLVNFDVAHHGDGRVLLVGDIDKGGVFGQLVGTLECMPDADRERVAGLIVNRFRGTPDSFADGAAWLTQRTGVPVLGVVPWAGHVRLELEDSLHPETVVDPPPPPSDGRFHAAVVLLPHLSNSSDLDALERHGVVLHHLSSPRDLSPYDLVLLPGSRHTRGDMAWLHATGWSERLRAHDGAIIGLCGGYQLLGRSIADPHGVEGTPGETEGLGLLPVATTMDRAKITRPVRGWLGDLPVEGYEIHVGRTVVDGPPLLTLGAEERAEGCDLGRVRGSYLHGLFDAEGAVEALLGPIRPDRTWPRPGSHHAWREQQLDAAATHLAGCLDLEALQRISGVALAETTAGPLPPRC
ncbi:MAG: cobyric acid synthase [Alphaproteobacteria bacterium]|nr:cobyric acid synthase [Alphaproteobacteria bacterium]